MRLRARLGDIAAAVPGTALGHDSQLPGPPHDPRVAGLHVWDPAGSPGPGQLVALTAAAHDPAVLAACSAAGAAGVLLRAPGDQRDRDRVAALCSELDLGLLWLDTPEPWWPALQAVEACLAGAAAMETALPHRPDDLFGLADEIAAAVGGPVILEDASFRVLAYSAFVGEMDRGRAEAILGRQIPDEWREHLAGGGSLQRLRTGSDVVDLADGPWQARRRLITSIRAGRRQLGVVWVAEGDRPLARDAAVALRRAADAAAPQLLRHLEQVEAEAGRRERRVRALLDGGPPALAAAAELGLAPQAWFAVLAVRSQADRLAEDETGSRLCDHVVLCCESFRHPCAVTRFGRDVVAVVELADSDPNRAAGRLLGEVVRRAGSGSLAPLHGAVSPVAAGVGQLPRLRDQAVAALAVLRDPGPQAVRFADVESRVLVREVVGRLAPGTGLSGIDRLRERDATGGHDLVGTLRAYLAACGSASAAAARLGVHVTTLRHRLARVEEVSGLSLDDPDVRVACELVLRLSDG